MAIKSTSPLEQQLADENRRLKRAVEELSTLNELARAIGASLNSQEIIHTIVNRSLRAVSAEQGVITLVDAGGDNAMKTLVRTMTHSSAHQHYHFHQSLMGWMHLHKKPITINDPGSDERFRGVAWDPTIRSLLAVPLMVKSGLRGVLTVYNKKGAPGFTDEDQRLLAIIAAQSAQVVENARLNESEQALLRMREELRLASQIQAGLLPKEFPAIPGYDIAGTSVPAQLVGGDYFDIISMEGGCLAVCLGDVSGKGLPASLLMANVQATVRGQTLLGAPTKDCMRRANKLLYESTSPEKFVTFFYGILDPQRHTFSFTNAGHDHPFLVSPDGRTVRLSTGGIALSILEDFAYEEEEVAFDPGSLLVVYSDGITEAINAIGGQFGQERLAGVVGLHAGGTAADLVASIIQSVKEFVGGVPQADDMTLVVVRRGTDA